MSGRKLIKGSEEAKTRMAMIRAKRKPKGGTIKDTVETVIYGRSNYKPNVKDLLTKHGGETIKSLTIIRNPIMDIWRKMLNVMSFGNFEKEMDKLPYDDLYHLRLEISTDKGTRLTLEKNMTIDLTKKMKYEKTSEKKSISNIPNNLNIIELLNNTHKKMGDNKFFSYSALNNNCQDFLVSVLDANNLGDASDRQFIKQDVKQIYKNNQTVSKFVDTFTKIGERIDGLISGAGNEKPKRTHKPKIQTCCLCNGCGKVEIV